MDDYLFNLTESIIIASRQETTEQNKLLADLGKILQNRPSDASEEMIRYIEFMIAVVKGENTEKMFQELDKNFQELFGNVIKKFKGADFNDKIREITKKSIIASRGDAGKKIETIKELQQILQSRPEGGSESVSQYLEYLMKVAEGTNTANAINALDPNLAGIFHEELQKIYRPDMMKFFTSLTEMAFDARQSDEKKEKSQGSINALLSGREKPPADINKYLELLLSVTNGTYQKGMKDQIASEFLELFNAVEKKYDI